MMGTGLISAFVKYLSGYYGERGISRTKCSVVIPVCATRERQIECR